MCGSLEVVTRNRCEEHRGLHLREDARIDGFTRFADDPECQRFVADHPDGASLEEIGQALGICRESVRLIEEAALKKLGKRLALVGIRAEDAGEYFASRARVRGARPWA